MNSLNCRILSFQRVSIKNRKADKNHILTFSASFLFPYSYYIFVPSKGREIMLSKSDSAEKMIQRILQEFYPAVEAQFELVRVGNENAQIYAALSALKSEFLSLVAYENRLVFPAILKVFTMKHSPETSETPNVAELQQLVRNKEQRLLQLVHNFSKEYKKLEMTDVAADKLIQLFDEDFICIKSQWGEIIADLVKNARYCQKISTFTNNK